MNFVNTNPGQLWKRTDHQRMLYLLQNLTNATNMEKNSDYSHYSTLTSIHLFSHHFEMKHHRSPPLISRFNDLQNEKF